MPTPERPRLRLVLAVSLDGRLAPPQGGAAQLGGPGDRRVLEEALAWADGGLIGARTLRLHGSTCLIRDADLLARRRDRGLSPQPVALVVSRTALLPASLPFWSQPLQRWLLAPQGSAVAPGFQRHLPLAPWPLLLAELARQGLQRLVLLGGASLAASLLAGDLVDELQLTFCPRLLGGPHLWLPVDGAIPALAPALQERAWQLQACRQLPGEEFLLRYVRRPSPAALAPADASG